jgi:hypothetical protein
MILLMHIAIPHQTMCRPSPHAPALFIFIFFLFFYYFFLFFFLSHSRAVGMSYHQVVLTSVFYVSDCAVASLNLA